MSPLDAIRDARARIVRAIEALDDGDREYARQLLDDLAADLWNVLELEERAPS